MIVYLSGSIVAAVRDLPNAGYMLTPRMGQRPDLSGIAWAADTGCFSQPATFDADAYLRWLASLAPYRATCLFATAPDRFGDGAATLAVALPMLPRIRALGYPAALVAQPGMESVPWDAFDVLFLGGPDAWQRSQAAQDIVDEAGRRGLFRHRGRVNSGQRLAAAAVRGFDSCDGTLLKYGCDANLPRLTRWLARDAAQLHLEAA